jgi:hypothetical protein
MTIAWLNKKDLVITSDGKVYNASVDNSASHTSLPKDNAESNSSDIASTIPYSGASVKRNSVTTSISDVAAADITYHGYQLKEVDLLAAKAVCAKPSAGPTMGLHRTFISVKRRRNAR